MRIAIIILITLLSTNFLNAQTWETLIPNGQLYDGEVLITDMQDGKYHIYRNGSILTLDKNGELESNINVEGIFFRKTTYKENKYVFDIENDTIVLSKMTPDGALSEITRVTYPIKPRPQGVAVVSENLFVCSTFEHQSDVDHLITFNSNGEILNSVSLGINTGYVKVKDNQIYVVGWDGLKVFTLDLQVVYELVLSDEGIPYPMDIDIDNNGELVFISKESFPNDTEGQLIIGRLDAAGNVIMSKEHIIETEDHNVYPMNIGINGDAIGVTMANIEIQAEFTMICLNDSLDIVDMRKIDDSTFGSSNIVKNDVGGFVYSYGKKVDPLQHWTNGDILTAVVSTDGSCYLDTTGYVTGRVFIDNNENDLFDAGDFPLDQARILHKPDSIFTYTNAEGIYRIKLRNGENRISIDKLNGCLDQPDEIIVQSESVTEATNFDFIVGTNDEYLEMEIVSNLSSLRCNTKSNLHVNFLNTGCGPLTGTISYQVNDLLTPINPDIDYEYEVTINPGNKFSILEEFQIADENFVGQNIEVQFNFNGEQYTLDTMLTQILRCAFDPNDKAVEPVVESPSGEAFATFDQELYYTIRFQNEGNDTAYNVSIRDDISDLLDMSTFRPIFSSHEGRIVVDGQELSYDFEDINLPPKTIDEVGSQGYLTFGIRPIAGLDEETLIKNSAKIYFDYNQPIITNETMTILVESLDADMDGFYFWFDCDDTNADVNTDQEEIVYNGLDDDCDPETLDDDLDQDGFGIDLDCDDTNADVNTNQEEIAYNGLDDDCDPATLDDDLDQDGFGIDLDCDDLNAEVNTDQEEIAYNGLDDDCDPETLDDDLDQDGFGIDLDCDDLNADVNTDQEEIVYNGLDDDCDPATLDDDLDQDGFGIDLDCDDLNADVNTDQEEIVYNGLDDDCDPATLDDDLDQDGFGIDLDCDDTNADVNTDQEEVAYNGLDDDCDPETLDDDLDQDGFGIDLDCDDLNADVNTDQEEIVYNGLDDDCDPTTLDDDLDQDGFGIDSDCDDTNADVNTDQEEIVYNGLDDDCDPTTLDDDLDQDGFGIDSDCDDLNATINPDAEEIPDNDVDENCDGEIVTSTSIDYFSNINCYPNPTSDLVYIDFGEVVDRIEITLIDKLGRTEEYWTTDQQEFSISLKDKQTGIYLLRISDLDKRSSKYIKLLVNR